MFHPKGESRGLDFDKTLPLKLRVTRDESKGCSAFQKTTAGKACDNRYHLLFLLAVSGLGAKRTL